MFSDALRGLTYYIMVINIKRLKLGVSHRYGLHSIVMCWLQLTLGEPKEDGVYVPPIFPTAVSVIIGNAPKENAGPHSLYLGLGLPGD